MRILITAIALGSLSLAASANDAPYADIADRDIAALSEDRAAGLLEGKGLGYALSAELNGVPGPLHVLELDLGLDDEQREAIQAVFDDMNAKARRLGGELIEAEATLDALFKGGEPDAAAVEAATARVAEIEGRLRAVHLVAHLQTDPLLTRHQRVLYARARGYGDGGGHGGHGGHN